MIAGKLFKFMDCFDNKREIIDQIAAKYGIKLIFGKPHHPRGRGKIEAYHKALYRELISLKQFKSLSDFRKQLWKFDNQYNNWRKQEILGWNTPASVYNNRDRYLNFFVKYKSKYIYD